jgi:hypothetical protein
MTEEAAAVEAVIEEVAAVAVVETEEDKSSYELLAMSY